MGAYKTVCRRLCFTTHRILSVVDMMTGTRQGLGAAPLQKFREDYGIKIMAGGFETRRRPQS